MPVSEMSFHTFTQNTVQVSMYPSNRFTIDRVRLQRYSWNTGISYSACSQSKELNPEVAL